jgi:hypothetical protein
MLVEIRAKGAQTIVPPSRHPEGERIRWRCYGEPAEIDPDDLRGRVSAFASAILLGRSWPKQGQRDKAALAVAGFLLQLGVDAVRVRLIIETAARIAGDEEVRSRGHAVKTTGEKMRLGKPVTAEAAARKLFGGKVIRAIGRWISENMPSGAPSEYAAAKPSLYSTADKIVALASDIRLFRATTDGGQAFGSITLDGRQETWRIGSDTLHALLSSRFHQAHGKTPTRSAIEDAMSVLKGRAFHGRALEPIALRIAEKDDAIYIDIADEERRVVKVTPQGWTIEHSCPVNFVRSSSMLPLPLPQQGGTLSALREFVNLETTNDWVLLVSWIVCSFHPRGPYPVLSLSGPQGSAKSTLCEVLKSITDPDQASLRSEPRNVRDLAIAARSNHVLAFDNLSSISRQLSDALCRLSTGGTFFTRRLYSNDEEEIFNATRPVIMNGIPDLLGQPDLLDRAIHLIVPKIRASDRTDLEEFRSRLEAARPEIFGAILDALCAVLRKVPSVRIERLPRMADFSRWSVALESHLGFSQGRFMRAYAENRQSSSMIALDESPLVRPIKWYLRKSRGWFEGTASELLGSLNRITLRWAEELRRSRDWPRRPNQLSGDLRRLAPYLEEVGIKFERGRDAKDKIRNRYIILRTSKRSKPSKRVAQIISDDLPPLLVRSGRRAARKEDGPPNRRKRLSRAAMNRTRRKS